MALRRLRWVASQLGVGPSSNLLEPAEVLVDLADLPPGWTLLDQRRWRTGQQRDQPWAARARELGSVTAWRSFAGPGGDRWLWAQASPLASAEDAGHALRQIWQHTLANRRTRVQLVATEDGPPLAVPAEQVLTRQERTVGPAGEGAAHYLAWSYRGVVSVLAGSSQGEPWPWQDLAELATLQSRRIDAHTGDTT